ncbi:MAG: hypothetical protein P1U72_18880 [Paracoccaceae bacterium]|nr:hypothetical protein [Paracoccaceae bacterium]
MSNRDIQPIKFACKNCGSLIHLNFKIKGGTDLDTKAVRAILESQSPRNVRVNQGVSYNIRGAKELPIKGGFDPKVDFVDLHLDFPVTFGKYVMGRTPFLEASFRAGLEQAKFHRNRLQLINYQFKKYPKVANLIRMYVKGYYGPFVKAARTQFKIDVKSNKLEDLNTALYTVVSHFILPFTLPDDSSALVEYYSKSVIKLVEKHKAPMTAFLQDIVDSKFLEHLQHDCLKLYKPIFEAELPLRPALFLDVDPTYASGTIAMRVSSQDFEEYKEVYKDLSEVLNRQLVLVAGINNLVKRGDHNAFAKGVRVTKGGKELAPSTLSKYADVSLGNKMLDLDDPWYVINLDALDNELRNAIAHNKIDYEDVSQTITYYPKLEGMAREKKSQIQLLDYMWRMLVLFREVHRLHHLVKCLNYATLIEPSASLIKRT